MTDRLAPVTLVIALAVLTWDVLLAGWVASRREAPRPFTALTAFCGLLVAPALVVAVATGTEAGSRTVSGISWIVPLVTCAFVLQVVYALAMRMISAVVAFRSAVRHRRGTRSRSGDYLIARHGAAPIALQGAVAAGTCSSA